MVVDYLQHRKNVLERFKELVGDKRANKFIKFYDNRYKVLGDNFTQFIDPLFAYRLLDDFYKVKKLGTQSYGIVGIGGSGKSTFLKNLLYFLDPTITHDRIHTKLLPFAKKLKEIPTNRAMKGIGLDEPDGGHHFSSAEGVMLRNIVGKWRQQQIFFSICATDISDIPTYIFRKLNVLIFLPNWGTAYVFRDMPKKKQFILQEIKTHYQRAKGYNVFFEYAKKRPYGFQKISTYGTSPLDLLEGKDYLKSKRIDYEHDIDSFIKHGERSSVKFAGGQVFARDYRGIIVNLVRGLYDNGVKQKDIALQANIPQQTVNQYIIEYKNEKKFQKMPKNRKPFHRPQIGSKEKNIKLSSDNGKKQS